MSGGDGPRIVQVTSEGRFGTSALGRSSRREVDAHWTDVESRSARDIVLYLHGGLVDEANAFAQANRLGAAFADAGALPFFFAWRTGTLEVVRGNVDSILSTHLFLKLAQFVWGQVARRLFAPLHPRARGPLGASGNGEPAPIPPPEAIAALEATVNRDEVLERSHTLEDSIRAELEEEIAVSRELPSVFADPSARGAPRPNTAPSAEDVIRARGTAPLLALAAPLAIATYQTLVRFARRRDHGLHCTITEELLRAAYIGSLGQGVWAAIKTAADRMWATNENVALDTQLHAGSYWLDGLERFCAARPDTRISVIAHSAGGIAACHLVSAIALRHPALRLHRLTLLAPACSISLFASALATGRIDRVLVFNLSDAAESHDALHPLLYPRSLLYLVSGLFEEERDAPLLGMMRHLTGVRPYDMSPLPDVVRHLRESSAIVVTPTAEDVAVGLRSNARHHGGFAEDEAMLSSLAAALGGP